jgi:DNA replication protein DnaC
VGKTGVGKTEITCGLLLKALENGYRCQFIRAQGLFDEMYASLADRSTPTIITTNLVYDEWHNFLGNKSMGDALLSRVRHYCHTVNIDGPSLRELQG